jgi:hypothetical protein
VKQAVACALPVSFLWMMVLAGAVKKLASSPREKADEK